MLEIIFGGLAGLSESPSGETMEDSHEEGCESNLYLVPLEFVTALFERQCFGVSCKAICRRRLANLRLHLIFCI